MKVLGNKNTVFSILLIITFIGFFVRIVNLSNNPPGLTWDEASLGYNAYSILKTGADEYGTKFPLSFRSFDDYKPPVYVYFSTPFVALFGLNEFSIRLLSVLAGTLLVPTIYYLVLELFKDKRKWLLFSDNSQNHFVISAALLSSLFIALSPWSIQHSRGAFEGNVGVFFLSLGVLFLLKGLYTSKFMYLSVIPLVLGMYSYHSFRLVIPLLLVVFTVIYWKDLAKQKQSAIVSTVLFGVLVLPIFYSLFLAQGTGSRLSMVTRYSDQELLTESIKRLEKAQKTGDVVGIVLNNRRVVYLQTTLDGYFDHFDPGYLFVHGDSGRHHHALNMGVLYLMDLAFIVLGLVYLIKHPSKSSYFLISWLLIAPLPSAITTGTPHAIRSIAMMPALHIIAAIGLVYSIKLIRSIKIKNIALVKPYIALLIMLFTLNIVYYFYQYFVQTPIAYAEFWQSENKKLYLYLQNVEDQYERIVVTYAYDQPYIYYLFFNKIEPVWYHEYLQKEGSKHIARMSRKIGQYEFRNIDYSNKKDFQNTLVVGAPDEIPEEESAKDFILPNGDVMYRVYIEN